MLKGLYMIRKFDVKKDKKSIEKIVKFSKNTTNAFKPHEIAVLLDVLNGYIEEEYEDHEFIVSEENDTIDGFAYYALEDMTESTWYLWWIAVSKQRKGIGTQLMKYMEFDLKNRKNCTQILIETGSADNSLSARNFYENHGYEKHAVVKGYYSENDDLVIFRKVFV